MFVLEIGYELTDLLVVSNCVEAFFCAVVGGLAAKTFTGIIFLASVDEVP